MRNPGFRLTALIALVVFLFGMLFGQLWPRPLVAAAPLAQYLPVVMKHWLAPGPAPTAVPGGPNYLMLGPSDFAIKGPSITGYGYGTPVALPGQPTPTPRTEEAPPFNNTIHLPQGAQVTQITVYYSGTTTLAGVTRIELQRQTMSTFETLATLPVAAAQTTDQVQSLHLADGAAMIDNSRYSYRLAIYSTRDPSAPFVAYQIRLDYQ